MCRARFFVFLALTSVSSRQIVSPDGIEISDELEATLRCLVRTWIRFEWSQRCENCVVPTEDQLSDENRLPECTPEALESAGIKVTQILAGEISHCSSEKKYVLPR
ncbi:Oidioi.mRNA.OKI2018_I69.XSR.g15142.t1.cds [Oikopleura dioica]|uniref:Oidioi.mRNA.OKI2018_I69.XSR.g15142.t1.cds n=1 Tax=Oikopleura dioica TaxID=34765 RepID=A0ABN7SG14_OIKDI|nr:Oidioi.mRNA.OKI2018_I69.XSR.g15142.t1.cds [Oikopleura dioica]